MYLSWKQDPNSVHKSWDAYFKTGSYQAPPTLVADYNASSAPRAASSGPYVISNSIAPQKFTENSA